MGYKSLTCAIAMSVGMLTAQLVLADLNDGLIAHYPFDGNAQDASENGNHGTVNGATLTEDRFGNADSAYDFDGQDDYIDLGKVKTNISSKFSISAEIKAPPDRSAFRVVLSKGLKSRSHFEVYIEKDRTSPYIPGELRFYSPNLKGTGASGSLPGDFGSGKVVDDDKFHHLVVTSNGKKTKFYLDGLMVYKEPTTEVYVDETAQFLIGRQTHTEHGNMSFKGVIDEVRIYNRVLSKKEVQALYQQQRKRVPCKPVTDSPDTPTLKVHCNFTVSFSRSDHDINKVYYQVVVPGEPSDSFFFKGCSTQYEKGKGCVSGWGVSKGARLLVNQRGEIVAEGDCCNSVQNKVISVTKSCNSSPALPQAVNNE